MAVAVSAEALRKRYPGSAEHALDGFDLSVPSGTVHGLLGPNGAGKTTAVRILATLLRADGGRATIDGYDVATQASDVRRRIGLVGQYAAVDEILDGRRNLVMFGRLFHLSPSDARQRADDLLARFDLTDAARRPVAKYSGGMRRRLDLAVSMILAPAVLFLDEPTTGLDPRGRAEVWDAVRALVADGTTVLLTTQYLDEADQLADRISVLAVRSDGGARTGGVPERGGGRVVAEGTPDELRARIGGDRIDLVVRHASDLPKAAALVERVAGTTADVDEATRRVAAPVRDRMDALAAVVHGLQHDGIDAEDLSVRRPTLDEVFLQLTDVEVPA
ncbi:ATP-binding cassette domain-containing protein [Pseudonocardia sp. MH-G8]|uniref:ATP-binding cassette domain-containing protein n=1 Tax=Pseudonocardia sp. MH-G8 TaxID=1854588 RepID=UPI000BA13AD5|nr:ATP-binding cassette domain-containing protein [Pseudonocardia sp. MH-G8]OZM78571.1 daunorubicin/doxorubicin resistance ABC transporter ATP-binding protein DrrA [Pseudonocardia sp. MH-G8]